GRRPGIRRRCAQASSRGAIMMPVIRIMLDNPGSATWEGAMQYRYRSTSTLGFALVLVMTVGGLFYHSILQPLLAQEKPKPGKFGSSLKQLKWDDKKKAAVETGRHKDNDANPNDVIRIETLLATFDISVTDEQGHYITGLGRDDFVLTEDGKSQEISSFWL